MKKDIIELPIFFTNCFKHYLYKGNDLIHYIEEELVDEKYFDTFEFYDTYKKIIQVLCYILTNDIFNDKSIDIRYIFIHDDIKHILKTSGYNNQISLEISEENKIAYFLPLKSIGYGEY